MTKDQPKVIGIVLIEKFADWEFGLLAAGAAEYFGARVVFLSPEGRPVTSIGGLRAQTMRGITQAENSDLDAIALIGSDNWTNASAPDVQPLLEAVRQKGGVIGGICAATVALARGGFVKDLKHTSNGPGWIKENAGDYPGAGLYQNVPKAVSDHHVVTAPGTAPVSFAAEFLAAVYPERREMAQDFKRMSAAEHS